VKPISFVIITYNRPADTLELLQNIATLHAAADLLHDIIVVNNASSQDYSAVNRYIAQTPALPFQFIEAGENLGVTRGRNFALQFAKGELVIFLDDDAVLQNPDALLNVVKAFNHPGLDNRSVAIVSFKVLYYDTLQMQVNALPHKAFEKYKNKDTFYTYYFAGGAHAIRNSVLQQVGNLPDEFFYGMEEYDLSYRVLNNGFCIKYDASIVMLHKESPLGRKPKSEKQRMMWVNKSKVAYRYLPMQYFYSTAITWSVEYLRTVGFDVKGWWLGWKAIARIPATEQRTLLQPDTLAYLKKVGARLWY
jgi:GT2 family glycosyltransferase